MHHLPMILNDPPTLSDEAAQQTLDLLYELITAFENHYVDQLRRADQADAKIHPDLFDDDLDF